MKWLEYLAAIAALLILLIVGWQSVRSAGAQELPPGPVIPMQTPCTDSESLVKYLDQKYRESEAGYGVSRTGNRYSVFVSDGGSFTIIMSMPNGASCLVGAGNNWEYQAVKGGKEL